jgi:hypothetical protein
VIGLLVWAALAQDPASEAPETPPDFVDGVEEVLVVGEHVVTEARAVVVRRLEALGYKSKRERDGSVILRPPEAWMGKATLTPFGDLELATPFIAVEGPRETGGEYNAFRDLNNDQQAGTVGLGTSLPGPRQLEGVHAEIRAAVDPALVAWREAIRRRALGRQLEALPDRLDALWLQGVGLDRTELPDHVQRRAALLEYWSSRADTLEGRAVTRALEIFLREVVATSAHPFTVEEIAQAESRREDGRRLDLPVEQGTIRVLTDPEAPNGP